MLLTKSKPRLSADSQINRILLIAEEKNSHAFIYHVYHIYPTVTLLESIY